MTSRDRSVVKTKHDKSVNFDVKTQEVNTMESHDEPIPNKKKGKK